MLDRFCFADGLAWLNPLPDRANYTYHNDRLGCLIRNGTYLTLILSSWP